MYDMEAKYRWLDGFLGWLAVYFDMTQLRTSVKVAYSWLVLFSSMMIFPERVSEI